MSEILKFIATIEGADGGGAFVTVPFDVEAAFGKKRVKVKATFDGEPYRGSLVRMGGRCHLLGVRKDVREKIGKGIGDQVVVTIEEDVEPRAVIVPPDLRAELESSPAAASIFDRLSYTHQKEYVAWIEEAKREETRKNRIRGTVEMLMSGAQRS